MKYFKDPDGQVFAYDDEQLDMGYPFEPMTEMTAEEVAAYLAPKPEQILAAAIGMRDGLLALATLRINPLQDAVDLDEATPEDVANLKLWKQYRVAVNRVTDQAGWPSAVTWPTQPA